MSFFDSFVISGERRLCGCYYSQHIVVFKSYLTLELSLSGSDIESN